MAKMTQELIEKLYMLGKNVYEKKEDIGKAVSVVLAEFPELISESSAKFYIDLVNELIIGKGSTWNQNSKLLVYYVEKIYVDYGKDSAEKAYQGAIKFALSKSREPLIQKLNEIKDKYRLDIKDSRADEKIIDNWWPALQDYTPDISKEQWIALLEDPKIIGTVWGEVLAMFYTEKTGATCKFIEQKFGKKAGSVNPTCMHLAKYIQEKTSRSIIESEDNPGQKKYWPILFQGREAKKDETGAWVWRLRNELYDALTEVNILRFLPKGGEEEMKTKDIIEQIKDYIAAKGFIYKDSLVENFYLSLKSKPFVILAGISGTGKTKLVKLFAEAIGANYKLVSVRPDWSDSSDLFGHVNLKNEFVPGAIIDYVKCAELDSGNPYFLCLDEMNLARVEYYLSDFLSIIETRHRSGNGIVTDEIILDKTAEKKYGKVILPDNLYVIGTVNMDETTFPFSKKVLDRANTIEFSYVDLIPDFGEESDSVDVIPQKNEFLVTEYLTLKSDVDVENKDLILKVCEELQDINIILQKANAHVGYRVRDEIVFYMLNNGNAELLKYEEAFDFEIVQKILPRTQGSSGAVKEMLCELFKKFAGDYTGFSQASVSEQMQEYINSKNCKYRRSAEKICYMMRRFEEDGFTSYWL